MVIYPERGANDLHMVQPMPPPPHHLVPVKSRMIYHSGAGLSRLSGKKRPLNRCSSSSSSYYKFTAKSVGERFLITGRQLAKLSAKI